MTAYVDDKRKPIGQEINVGLDGGAQQTSYQGGSQQANQYVREAMRIKRQTCTATGGFNKGQGDNHECLYGEDAVAHIEGIGENAPAYDRAQQWLSEYNEEPDLYDPYSVDGEDPFDDTGAYAIDTDGDGFVDTVVRDNYIEVAGENGIETQIETVRVNGNAELDAEVQAAQDLKDSIYNQEGWDDLEPWEQDQQLINAGGTAINGTDGNPPEEPEEPEETLVEGVTSTVQEGIDKIKEEFPTWEELWGNIKDALPSDPEEWGDAIRGVLTSVGVDLPSGDIWEILNGGYGVIATGGGSIFNPANQNVFIPGIPVGLPPSSTVIGTVEDLINDPVGTLVNKVKDVFGDIVSDPGAFVQGILEGTLDVPSSVWDVLVGGVAAGQDVYDWVKETIGSSEEETIVGGEEEEVEEQTEEQVEEQVEEQEEPAENARVNQVLDFFSSAFNSVPDPEEQVEEPEDGLTFGGESVVYEQGEINPREQQVISLFGSMFNSVPDPEEEEEEEVITGGEVTEEEEVVTEEEECDPFTFGGGSGCNAYDPVVQDPVVEDPIVDTPPPPPPEEPPITGGGGASGGAGGSNNGEFEGFLSGIDYNPLQIQALIESKQRKSLVSSLFSEYFA